MAHQLVSDDVAVRRSRARFVDSDRLARRRDRLVHLVRDRARDFDNRADWVVRVAELQAVERELVARGDLPAADAHLQG